MTKIYNPSKEFKNNILFQYQSNGEQRFQNLYFERRNEQLSELINIKNLKKYIFFFLT